VAWTPAIIIRGYILTFTTSDFCEETLAWPTGEAAGPLHKFYAAAVFEVVSSSGNRASVTPYYGVAHLTPGRLG
jgi:hypothetical protein